MKDKRQSEPAAGIKPVNAPPHAVEWLAGAASAFIVAAMVAYLAFIGFTEEGRPARFETQLLEVRQDDDQWHVSARVRNTGEKTAADVLLRGVTASGEESEVTFDYVPAGSDRNGTLLFSEDPASLVLSIRGYTDP